MAEMALKERSHSAVGAGDSAAPTLLSPDVAAMNFAASFHHDAQACHSARERERLHEVYRDKILAIDVLAANVAAAFRPLLSAVGGRDGVDSERWADFDRLAKRGKNMRDLVSQRLQHQSGIIAAWGLECFRHYSWHMLPLPLLRQLHDLAVLMPRWDHVVDLLSSKMLARHESRVIHGKNRLLRVGEHSAASKVQDSRSPVERSDILAALDWARQKASSAVARQQVKDAARGINGTSITHFGLKRDLYGMVVPSIAASGPGENKDSNDIVDDLDLSPGPTQTMKLSATRRSRPVTPGSLGNSKRRKQHARGNASVTLDCSDHNSKSSEFEKSEVEAGRRLVQQTHTGEEQALGMITLGQMPAGNKDTPDLGSQSAYGDVETPNPSTMGTESRGSSMIMNHAESAGDDGVNEINGSQGEQGEGEEAEEAESSQSGGSTAAGEQADMDLDSISTQGQNSYQTEEEQNKTGANAEGELREDETEEHEEQEEEGTHEQEQVGPSGDGDGEGYEGAKDAGAVAETPENILEAENIDATIYTTYPNDGDSNERGTTEEETRHPTPPPSTQTEVCVTEDSDSQSLQRPTLLQTLKARYAADVLQLVRDLSRPHASPEVTQQRRLQLDWLDPQRWAGIYAEPEAQLGRGSVASSDDADVWYLNWDTFHQYAASDYIFSRPVVIKQDFEDSGMYDIDEYIDMLWQRFPERQIDVQDSTTGVCTSMSMKEYCLTVTNVNLSSSDATAPISNAINLRRLARANEPLLSRLPRFRLLSTLADRMTGIVGTNEYLGPNDVQGSLGFDLLGLAGAFSASHVDALGGSWVRCLVGYKIWAIAPNLEAEDWQRFSKDGCDWSPQGKGRLIVLEQDDVLFMPPGLHAVQANFTPEPCLMEGGMLWDECNIPDILQGLLWIVENQGWNNEGRSFQLSALVDTLEQWFDDDNYDYTPPRLATATEHRQTVKAGIRSLQAMLRSSL